MFCVRRRWAENGQLCLAAQPVWLRRRALFCRTRGWRADADVMAGCSALLSPPRTTRPASGKVETPLRPLSACPIPGHAFRTEQVSSGLVREASASPRRPSTRISAKRPILAVYGGSRAAAADVSPRGMAFAPASPRIEASSATEFPANPVMVRLTRVATSGRGLIRE
jgi:hypothetical protein